MNDPRLEIAVECALRAEAEAERDVAWAEQRAIREAIGANLEEATIDEVQRVIAERDADRAEIAEARHILKCPENTILTEWCQASRDDFAATDEIMRRADAAEAESKRARAALLSALRILQQVSDWLAPLRSTAPDSLSKIHDIVLEQLEAIDAA